MNTDINIQNLLHELEEKLLRPEVRRSKEELERLLAEEFVEFGSRGIVYNRERIIESLATEPPCDISIQDLRAVSLTTDITLVTYRAEFRIGNDRPIQSLRSSIWRLKDGRWQMVFHQGTPITEDR